MKWFIKIIRHTITFKQLLNKKTLTQFLVFNLLDQRDLVLVAKGLDQLHVLLVVAVFGEEAQVRFLAVQRLGGLVESPGHAIVRDGGLEHLEIIKKKLLYEQVFR